MMKMHQLKVLIITLLRVGSISEGSVVPLYLNPGNSLTAFYAWTNVSSHGTYSATNAYSSYSEYFMAGEQISCNARVKYETNTDSISIMTEFHNTSYPVSWISAGGEINAILQIGTTGSAFLGTLVNLEVFGNWGAPYGKLKILRGSDVIFDEYAYSPVLDPINISIYAGEELALEFDTGFGMDINASGEIFLRATEVPEPATILLFALSGLLLRKKSKS